MFSDMPIPMKRKSIVEKFLAPLPLTLNSWPSTLEHFEFFQNFEQLALNASTLLVLPKLCKVGLQRFNTFNTLSPSKTLDSWPSTVQHFQPVSVD